MKTGSAKAVLTTVGVEERQISGVEVVWAPTDGHGVKSDDKS
jgi:hypothetical protein